MKLIISINAGRIEVAYLHAPFDHLIACHGEEYKRIRFERLIRREDFEQLKKENQGLQTLLDAYRVTNGQPNSE